MSMMKLAVAAVLSVAVAMPAGTAFAQNQKKPSKREAAMEKCLASIQGPDQKDRIAQYSACMKKEGQRP